jgi:hypothetical protein
MGKYFRYGLVGNLIMFGSPIIFLGYTCWILNDLNENHSVKMSA